MSTVKEVLTSTAVTALYLLAFAGGWFAHDVYNTHKSYIVFPATVNNVVAFADDRGVIDYVLKVSPTGPVNLGGDVSLSPDYDYALILKSKDARVAALSRGDTAIFRCTAIGRRGSSPAAKITGCSLGSPVVKESPGLFEFLKDLIKGK